MLVRPKTFTTGAPNRIFGLEIEADVQIPGDTPGATKDFELLKSDAIEKTGLAVHTLADGAVTRWLTNGGNIHPDVGRVEYSTPESNSPRDAAASKLAGFIVINRIAATHPGAKARDHAGTTIGEKSRTLGQHNNFMAAAAIRDPLLPQMLDSFDVSSVWAWGGRVGPNGFELCQKEPGVGTPTSYDRGHRTREEEKPLGWIKIQDSDVFIGTWGEGWARSERRLVDGGQCRVTQFMVAAAGSAVLRLYEHRRKLSRDLPFSKLLFKNPLAVLKQGSRDLTLSKTYPTVDDQNLTLLDMQDRYVEYLDYLSQIVELPKQENEGIDLLCDVTERLSKVNLDEPDNNALRPIMGWTNFAPHLAYVRRSLDGASLTSQNNDAIKASYRWSELAADAPSSKYWAQLYRKGQAPDPIGDELIADHITTPPPGTRAVIRGQAVSDETIRRQIKGISWSLLDIGGRPIPLHPYQTDPSVLYKRR